MLKRFTWMLMVLLALMAFWGCEDDDATGPVIVETAFEVMAEAGEAYVNDNADCPGVISATDLNTNLELYTVLDLRGETDYLNGHIPGAINVTLGTLQATVAAKTLAMDAPIAVVCYTGQTAGHAKIALELLGYENVKSLLWGMSSWSMDVSGPSWEDGRCGDALAQAEMTNNNASLTTHDFPVLTEPTASVVADRVSMMLQNGFKKISYAQMTAKGLNDYFIVNYFGESDYLGTGSAGVPGHIPGAYQFTPYNSLGMEQMLDNLPTDMPIVVYCWTGQHSSQIAAYLNVLGYDAYSLLQGSNGLFHSSLTGHKWTVANVMDYPLEVGYPMDDDFRTLAEEALEYVGDNADCPGVISATDLNNAMTATLGLYEILDLRSASDFNYSHIPGAINVSLGGVVDAVDGFAMDQPIAVVCYTGQTAGHAKIALELLGYENTKSLLWGMSSWSADVQGSNWGDGRTGDNLDPTDIETDNNNGDLEYHAYPTLPAGTAMEDRVNAMLVGGFKKIGYATMEGAGLESYFIMNYFGEADYLGTGSAGVPGHIEGAFQFTPYSSLDVDAMLNSVPSDMPIVVYCWTGQHSSQVTAFLNILGYDAYSLLQGSNGLFHSSLTGHKWSAANVMDLPLEGTYDD